MHIWHYVSQAFLAQDPLASSSPPATSNSLSKIDTNPNTNTNMANATIYFGYGSNLWRHQMQQRCPTSEYLGVARLNDYKWIINERGYANVVELPRNKSESPATSHSATSDSDSHRSYANEVWGLVYTLQREDESRLDRNEGVPIAYAKEMLGCDFWAVDDESGEPANVTAKPEKVEMLVYINREAVEPSPPKKEYVYRMNEGIKDAVQEGVPKGYVKEVMRKYIPEKSGEGDEKAERVARSQAAEFEDER